MGRLPESEHGYDDVLAERRLAWPAGGASSKDSGGRLTAMTDSLWNKAGRFCRKMQVLRSMDAVRGCDLYRIWPSLSDDSHGTGCAGRVSKTAKDVHREALASAVSPVFPVVVCPVTAVADPSGPV
jgi:hypothetical protein